MIASWMAYALVVSGLVSVAAWLAERGFRARGWPARPVWAAALGASVVVPVAALLRPPPAPRALAVPGAYVLDAIPVAVGAAPGPSLERVVLVSWGAATLLLLAVVIALAIRLAVRRRHWTRRVVSGVEVLVSRRTGPAAMGVLRGRVVVPEWALSLDESERRLLIAHEAEHVRARDPQLALAGLLLCVAAPWNLPLWWQLRRLRLAIEVDCDARVLREKGDARRYAALLLAVGQRRAHLALALAEPRTMLERRIRMITMGGGRRSWLAAAVLGALAALTLAVACETPSPTDSREEPAQLAPDEGRSASDDPVGIIRERVAGDDAGFSCAEFIIDGRAASQEEARDLVPEVIERIEVVKGEAAAAAGGDASCGMIYISTQRSDQELARQYEAQQASPGPTGATDTGADQESDAGPTFTPMTERPRLRNEAEIVEALGTYHPPLLRDAGIGGTTNVWFYIDETGRVAEARVNESSGYEALDQAALAVARQMAFTPAKNRDETVAVWVALNITFEAE